MKLLNMWWTRWCEFLVVFSSCCYMTQGHSQDSLTTSDVNIGNGGVKVICNDTKALDECWNKLPPLKDHGIPSNPQSVENACKVFDTGMDCVDNWSKACLTRQDQERVKSSIIGALETYKFLCSDKKFRREFLQHSDCYRKISVHWDDCARKFIESLKRVDLNKDTLGLCCIRFHYLRCVTEVANHHCSKNATKFLQKLAESLVRSSVRTYHPNQCSNVGDRNCSDASSAQSSTKFFSTSPSTVFHTILYYPTKGVINSLNVLQNLAFSDITTFFCTLSREFSPYFSYPRARWEEDTPFTPFSSIMGTTNNAALPDTDDTQET